MDNSYEVLIKYTSLDTYEDEFDIFGDNGHEMEEAYSTKQVEFMLKNLTRRQREILQLVLEGYKRKEIAEKMGICIQAVHQIIPRIRKRIKALPGVNKSLGVRFNDFAK